MNNRFKVYNQSAYKPYMTYIFLALNIGVYVYMLLRYGTTTNTGVLLEVGANSTEVIVLYNQWWRLLTAAFIHIGFQHILMNGLTLYFLGIELEAAHGHVKFAIIYLLSAIGGNFFSFAFNINAVSAGASTAIFGMFASYLVLSYMNPQSRILQLRSRTFTILLVLNFLNGVLTPGIDNWGHLGGAVFGALVTYGIARSSNGESKVTRFLISMGGLLVLTVILLMIGRNSILG